MASILKVDTIQDQSGNNIINESADTITIGASGDTITIPSGATLSSTDPLVFPAGTVSLPAITTTGDTNTGIFFPAADTIAFSEGGAEAMRIDSSGNVLVGTTSGTGVVSIEGIGTGATTVLKVNNTSSASFVHAQQNIAPNLTTTQTVVNFIGKELSAKNSGYIGYTWVGAGSNSNRLTFGHYASDYLMNLTADGNVLMAKTTTNFNTAGLNYGALASLELVRSGGEPLNINRLASDGTLVAFYQAGALEGNISVSGATVSYNGFTGTHWSRFIDESKPDVLRGTVMETLDQMTDWYHVEFETSYTEQDKDGNDVVKTIIEKKPYALKANEQEGDVITYNWNTEKKDEDDNDIIEQVQATIVKQVDVKHVMSKISDTVEAKNVYGVFSAWDNDDLINNDFYVASVGSYVVRIKAGQIVSKGDLLQSNGDGTAKVQADDMIRASTFAKVLSNTVIQTYEDGSFIVPCSLMC
jgi:hypothetical protein